MYQMLGCATAREKLPWFFALAFMKGASLGGLVEFALKVDPGIIATAFSATALIFTCFSLAALLTTRRSMLYLGGILGSALSAMARATAMAMAMAMAAPISLPVAIAIATIASKIHPANPARDTSCVCSQDVLRISQCHVVQRGWKAVTPSPSPGGTRGARSRVGEDV